LERLGADGGQLTAQSKTTAARNPEWFNARRGEPRQDRRRLHHEILARCIESRPGVRRDKKAIGLAGPPGAGKSTAQGALIQVTRTQPEHRLPINADDFKDELLQQPRREKKMLAVDPALMLHLRRRVLRCGHPLIALATEEAKSFKGVDIAAHLIDVSEGGEKCNDFPSCVILLRNGKDIDYDGQQGPVTFSDAGDPTEACIGIYEYQDNNTHKPSKEEFGNL
jgi:hypothetical protein